MSGLRRVMTVVLGGMLLLGLSASVMAQDQGGGGGGNAPGGGGGGRGGGGGGWGGGGGRGGWDPAAMRQQMMDRVKERLGASDEEWKAVQPKVEKVMAAEREAQSGGGMRLLFGGGRQRGGGQAAPGGAGGAGGPPRQPETAVAKAQQELQTTLDDKNSTPEQITQKLTALRQAKEKAKADLAQAQKELRELLTQRQEAALVATGMLE